MAETKKYIIEETDLINIADSVRTMRGTTAKMDVKTIPQEILNIETRIPEGYLKPEGTQLITKNGTYDIGEYANVNVNVPIPEGYLDPEGTQKITANGGYNVELLEWVDVNVPVPDGYIIPVGKISISDTNEVDVTDYATAQIVDSNLVAENIAENIEILGVTGTFKGRIDTSDGTATSDDMLLGKTAYVNDNKVVGNIETWDGTFVEDVEIYSPLNDYLKGTKTEITKDDLEGITTLREYFLAYQPITSIEFSDSVMEINNFAFMGCKQLTSVVIPETITGFGARIFEGCSGLVSVTLPKNMKSIPQWMFISCSSLPSMEIPETVTRIADRAFTSCSQLTEVICLPKTPPTLGSVVFYGVPTTCKIYVPKGSGEAYKTATNWSEWADYIVEMEE